MCNGRMLANICKPEGAGSQVDGTRLVILVALGANLPHPVHGVPRRTVEAAIAALEHEGVEIVARSRFYETAPVPASDQPWFVNAVVAVRTSLPPAALLALLHRIEAEFGRVRGERDAPRLLDLDLIDYDGIVCDGNLVLPHPRMHERLFVLLPLGDVAPHWRHPRLAATVDAMIDAAPADPIRALET